MTTSSIEIDWDATQLAYFTIGRNPRYGVTWLRRGVDTVESVEVAQHFDRVPNGEPLMWVQSEAGFLPASSVRFGDWESDEVLAPVDIMPEWNERWAVDTSGRLVHLTIATNDVDED